MSLFLETIKINNGRRENLDGHSLRMNTTRNRHFHEIRDINLHDVIQVPEKFKKGIVKCRVIYGRHIENITYEHYKFKNPRSFKVLAADHIGYSYKYADREGLNQLFSMRGKADDILMIQDGNVTDSFYANVAFLKEDLWYTPKKPMLAGSFRRKLILNEKLVEVFISESDIVKYDAIKIFNALTEWEMHEPVDIELGETIITM